MDGHRKGQISKYLAFLGLHSLFVRPILWYSIPSLFYITSSSPHHLPSPPTLLLFLLVLLLVDPPSLSTTLDSERHPDHCTDDFAIKHVF